MTNRTRACHPCCPAIAAVLVLSCNINTFGISEGSTNLGGSGANSDSDPQLTSSTTVDPGLTASASTGATSALPTTTTTMTTTAADNCDAAPECEPGAVESGELCDGCGVQRRTCQPDCTWTPMVCEQELETCAYWLLPSGATEWQRVPVDPESVYGPKETVLAAIALPPQKQIYVLTANYYHVLSTDSQTWVAAGSRDALLPELKGQHIYSASGLTSAPPDTIVNIVAGNQAFAYTFSDASKTFAFDAQFPCCGDSFVGPNAPDPYAVRDFWSQPGDPEGWIPGDLQVLCNLDMPTEPYAYSIYIGDGFVYPQDVGYCFDFYAPVSYAEFAPFTYIGAPLNELIGGADWLEGLWVFRGE